MSEPEALEEAAALLAEAAKTLATNPAFRHKLVEWKLSCEQTIGTVTEKDEVHRYK